MMETEGLAREIVELATHHGITVGCAESCTGGLVAAALTSVPGSSAVFIGGVVSYARAVKESLLGVDRALIAEHGVVSAECAKAMAIGARETLGCMLSVSTTGIAGPGGAMPGKPVGTVWYGVSGTIGTRSCLCHHEGTREEVREAAVKTALTLLRDELYAIVAELDI